MDKKDTNPKDALGMSRPPLSTVPMNVLFEVGTAMLEGACKYRRHNYRVSGVRMSVYFDAALRHLSAWWEGQDIDPDSGIHHVSKAIAGLAIVRDAMMQGKAVDDRPPVCTENWMEEAKKLTKEVLAKFPDPEVPYTKENSDG